MKWSVNGPLLALLAASWPAEAEAETFILYTDPMTFERKLVVRKTPGPDRAFHCFLPPSDIGCQRVPLKRGR